MSNKPKTGDKYVIEIECVYEKRVTQSEALANNFPFGPQDLYKIKGFPSVVFTEWDLKNLERYEGKEDQPGKSDVGVGDEVLDYKEERIAVTRVFWEDGQIWFEGVNGKGEICGGNVSDAEPTGRKVPGITKALEFIRADIGK